MLYGAYWELSGLGFSPDGKTIAYNSVEPGDRFRAQLVDVDGTNRRPIAPPVDAADNYSQAWPVFSPDGRWIAMESWVGVPGGAGDQPGWRSPRRTGRRLPGGSARGCRTRRSSRRGRPTARRSSSPPGKPISCSRPTRSRARTRSCPGRPSSPIGSAGRGSRPARSSSGGIGNLSVPAGPCVHEGTLPHTQG